MTTPLSQYRDIVKLLFAVTNYSAANRHELHLLLDKIHDILQKQENEYSPIAYMPSALYEIRPPTPPSLVIHPDQDTEGVVPNVVVTKEEPEIHEVRNLVVNLPPVVHAVKMEPASSAPAPSPEHLGITGPAITDSDAAILSDLQRDMETVEENEIGTPTATDACDEDEVADDDDVEDEEDVEVEEEEEEAEEDEEEEEGEEAEEEDDDAEEEGEEAEEEGEEAEEEEDDDLELLKIKKQRYYWSPSSKRIYEYLEEGYGDCIGTYEDGKIIPKA